MVSAFWALPFYLLPANAHVVLVKFYTLLTFFIYLRPQIEWEQQVDYYLVLDFSLLRGTIVNRTKYCL